MSRITTIGPVSEKPTSGGSSARSAAVAARDELEERAVRARGVARPLVPRVVAGREAVHDGERIEQRAHRARVG
jgi:hypothetical protein